MNNNVYCADSLDLCNLSAKYRFSFGEIVKKDCPSKSFGFGNRILEAECIDVDKVEVDRNGNNGKTMDLVIGLADFDDVKQAYTRHYLLPIELKLNCVTFNLRQHDLKGKDSYTRNILIGTFSEKSVFVFTEKVAAQALSYCSRWKREAGANGIKDWIIVNPHQLDNLIKFTSDFPYKPKTDFSSIVNSIEIFIERSDIDGCYDYIANDVWRIVESFGSKEYNINEISFLYRCLEESVGILFGTLKKDEKDYLMIAIDKIMNFSKSLLGAFLIKKN